MPYNIPSDYHFRRVPMGVPNSQLTTIFSAKYQLTTIFLANYQLTTVLLAKYQLTVNPIHTLFQVSHKISYTMIWLKLACTYRLDTLWTPTEAWIIGKLSWNCSFLLLLTVQSQFSKRSDGNSVHLLGLGVRHWRKRFSVSTKNSKSYHPFFVLEVLNQWERMYKYTMKCTN